MTHLRRTALPAVLMLAGGLLAATPASATGPATCRGEAATIVSTDSHAPVTGTEGRDVIVAAGHVAGLGGDDVICSDGAHHRPIIDAGPGNDVVEITGMSLQPVVVLGSGADVLRGSVMGAEQVNAGTVDGLDTEKDVIDTGAPDDEFFPEDAHPVYGGVVRSGQPGTPNADVVTMGWGELFWSGIPTAGSAVDGGGRGAAIFDSTTPDAWVLDNVAGTLAVNDQPSMKFAGFTRFDLGFDLTGHPVQLGSLEFRGNDSDELLLLSTVGPSRLVVDMAGGDDLLSVRTDVSSDPRTSYDGGAGHDVFRAALPGPRHVELHLGRGRLREDQAGGVTTMTARHFEDADLEARRATLVGSAGDNDLSVLSCRSRIRGLSGHDRITSGSESPRDTFGCSSSRGSWAGGPGSDELAAGLVRSVRLAGGRGADELEGSMGRDRLIGGKGRDRADGWRGRDACEAERVRRCEVRPHP